MPYISNTDAERKQMLQEIGANSFEDLISDIPKKFRLKNPLKMDAPLSEMEMIKEFSRLADKNKSQLDLNSFLGAGVYDHFIPAAVDHIILKPEFYTAYTPYQAEVSQGTLQYIYEYQTLIARLTGMEISNAGMYDGASAAAEAIVMAIRKNRKQKVVISENIHPIYLEVIKSYTIGLDIEIVIAPSKNGILDLEKLEELMDKKTSSFLLQTPNFYGNIEDAFKISEIVHSQKKAIFIVATDPISLPILNSPAEYAADIVVGEGQALGNAENYGGPLFGFIGTSKKLARKMPGRISGRTEDKDGKVAYTLTLQGREQHIRRDKATSNICSNESLCTLAATVYMSLMGKEGMKEVATQSATKAHYLANQIIKIDGFEMMNDMPFFKEFAIRTKVPAAEIVKKLEAQKILAGLDLKRFGQPNLLLIAVTEKKTKADLDKFVELLKEV
ncbi:MAG: aminomethyl-transferring glycine dehydrogenase subunit GcvPA [Candidatus Cloacimonadota bacterium]|nr:aminomethyl-transferring glycine dehydrogenase subunit GcvPA [Candidatus Cloacimonadota bacterium]